MARWGRSAPMRATVISRPAKAAAPPTGTVYSASGTVAATSATSGTVSLRAAATGTVAAVSTTTGDATRLARTYTVTGTVAAVSSTSGAATILGAQPRQLASTPVAPRYGVRALTTPRYGVKVTDSRFTIRTQAPRHSATTKTRYAVRSL